MKKYKDGGDDFETVLENAGDEKDKESAQEILKLLRKKGLDRESRILGGLRNFFQQSTTPDTFATK